MLSVGEITPIPEVQDLILELDPVLAKYYRCLPHHSYQHARDEVLPEALRLDGLEVIESPLEEVLELTAASLTHDINDHIPLDPEEGFKTKEERAAAIAGGLLPAYGFTGQRLTNVRGAIITTAPGTTCETPNQVKLRRGDISNVGSVRRPVFLATAVNIFHEKVILNKEAGTQYPAWQKFTEVQQRALFALLSQDLSVGSEKASKGMGVFNQLAMVNARWLSKAVVSNPNRFVGTYRRHLKVLVPRFAEIEPYIIGQAAA